MTKGEKLNISNLVVLRAMLYIIYLYDDTCDLARGQL
jgi:hypothetical protein